MNANNSKKKVTWRANEYVPIVAHKTKCFREEEDEDVSASDASFFGRCFDCVIPVVMDTKSRSSKI